MHRKNKDSLTIIWNSDFFDKIERKFSQALAILVLLYSCTIWILTKRLEKKIDVSYTKMIRAVLIKSWNQHPTKHQLYGHLPPISQTIQVRRVRHSGHCWRSQDELISDVLLWTPIHWYFSVGRAVKIYFHQLCVDTVSRLENLARAMAERDGWQER